MSDDTSQKKSGSKSVVAAVGLAATLMATALPVQAAPDDDESLISEMIAVVLGKIEPTSIDKFNSLAPINSLAPF